MPSTTRSFLMRIRFTSKRTIFVGMQMKFVRYWFVLFLIFFGIICQADDLDSLMRLLNKTIDKRERIDLLNKISQAYRSNNPDSMMYFADIAYREAIAANYAKGEIGALLKKCQYYINNGDNDTAMELVKNAELLAQTNGLKTSLADAYLSHGDILLAVSLMAEAYTYYVSALDIYKDSGDLEMQILCINRMGMLFGYNKDYDKALEFFNKALKIAKESNNQKRIPILLNNIAKTNMEQGNAQSSLKTYREILEITTSTKNFDFTAVVLGNIATYYAKTGSIDSAFLYYDKAMDYAGRSGNFRYKNQILVTKAELYVDKGEYEIAKHDLDGIFNVSQTTGWRDVAMECARLLSVINKDQKHYESALHYMMIYNEYSEEMQNSENTKKLTALQIRHDLEQEAIKMKEKNRRKNQIIAVITIFSILAISLILILVIHLRTRVAKSNLKQKNLLLEKEKLKLEQQNVSMQLEMRSKEVVSNLLMLQKKNEVINGVTKELYVTKTQLKGNNKKAIEKCIDGLQKTLNDSDWNNFDLHFNQVYESFYKKLDAINPSLTQNEHRLCAYIRLKLSTKEIAEITNSSPRSIDVARYRIRKKLHIDGPSTSLGTFLEHL